MTWIEAAVKWVRSMFLLVDDRELDLAVGQAGDHLIGRGAVTVTVGGVVSTTKGNLGVGVGWGSTGCRSGRRLAPGPRRYPLSCRAAATVAAGPTL